ncbi:SNF2-like helicase [Hokovirus HKV1]|uniref:SNF2-like helicase n=1 Tax=Hokovirus HKV1 TaxID=1977638 RepID=A0A1V0SGY9_9VIRU|nr:SNF2-like helicase [Hokovirus HKV1]
MDNLKDNKNTSDDIDELIKYMKIEYSYPSVNEPNFQEKIYRKREFYGNKYPERDNVENYENVKEYRNKICARKFALYEHQALLSNFINMETPYRGLLVVHGTGTGKTGAGIAIAEMFVDLVEKYGNKILVLVPGTLIKEKWKNDLIKLTGNKYLSEADKLLVNEADKTRAYKNALNTALQYYKFMTHRTFYRKVTGEKSTETVKTDDGKVKKVYRKDQEGEFVREFSVDRILQLNNTIIIVDEAHRLTGNQYGDALSSIIKKSINLKIVLLTATPMKNLADDIVELLNFIRPQDDLVKREKIFTGDKNHTMALRPGGLEYLKKKAQGYVSYLRGADPLIFAKRVEVGEKPKELLFTKVTRCIMSSFQNDAYTKIVEMASDALDKKSESVANFAFPALSENKKSLTSVSGPEGIGILKQQLKLHSELLNKKIAELLGVENNVNEEFITYSDVSKTITGSIMKLKYLRNFSSKFHDALTNINKLVSGQKGPRTCFVYSNLVKVGIELFKEVLLQNGYLEYEENYSNYKITDETLCYYCGNSLLHHKQNKNITDHEFYPSTFISFTGKNPEDTVDIIAQDKQRILNSVFNNVKNKNGKYIKLVLGSKVMTEGIDFANIAEVHILDVYYNFGTVDQVIGRAIRNCSHMNMINDSYKYPEVHVYKYVVALEKELSSEEKLYQKAEQKYLLIKQVERGIKEAAIDCPLNRNGNIFPEELKEYKDCVSPGQPNPNNKVICPQICDFTDCNYLCMDPLLNSKYYNKEKNIYNNLLPNDIDLTTFNKNMSKNEINNAIEKIKEMFKISYMYKIEEIIEYVKDTYAKDKKTLFDDFFVLKALEQLIPVSENDFNNFKNVIHDKLNNPGYLIYIGGYYIFQPFNQPENITMYYRTNIHKDFVSGLTLYDYINNVDKFANIRNLIVGESSIETENISVADAKSYNFNDVFEYYDNREEFDIVGVIDKEMSKRKGKNELMLANKDVFKIREKRDKTTEKKRGVGIPNLFGAVCITAKDKNYLKNISKKLGISDGSKVTRNLLCSNIENKLLFMEKYSTTKAKNKFTYMMIPKDHPVYKFPYNLEDRVDYYKQQLLENVHKKLHIEVKTNNIKVDNIPVNTYTMIINDNEELAKHHDYLKENFNAVKKDKKWIIEIN